MLFVHKINSVHYSYSYTKLNNEKCYSPKLNDLKATEIFKSLISAMVEWIKRTTPVREDRGSKPARGEILSVYSMDRDSRITS